MLIDTRGINLGSLLGQSLPVIIPFPDLVLSEFLFSKAITPQNPATKSPS